MSVQTFQCQNHFWAYKITFKRKDSLKALKGSSFYEKKMGIQGIPLQQTSQAAKCGSNC